MERSEKFINWLEGFLDASKNKINVAQIKEIRKKIKEYHEQEKNDLMPLYDTLSFENYSSWNRPGSEKFHSNLVKPEENEEYLKEIEKNKNASTMEELV